MRSSVVGIGLGVVIAAAAFTFLLFETTTTSSMMSSSSNYSSACGQGGSAWPDPWTPLVDEVTYTREVRDRQRVEITLPSGIFEVHVEALGTELIPLPSWGQADPGPDRCPAEPSLRAFVAHGAGTIHVRYLLFE